MLRTRSIKAAKRDTDGLRISVMSRHTLSDGITPDPEITEHLYDIWWRRLAPPSRLVGEWYRGVLEWEQFEALYLEYLVTQSLSLRVLAKIARETNVTVLCVEEDPSYCHRRLLAQRCGVLDPALAIAIE